MLPAPLRAGKACQRGLFLLALLSSQAWGLPVAPTEPPAVAAQLTVPPVSFETPGFARGRADFTSEPELEAFVQGLRARTGRLEVKTIGVSQQGLPIRMLSFGVRADDRPTVLLVAMQRGDAPAAGEAALVVAQRLAGGPWAGLLDAMNVLVVPRANPDGALLRTRATASGVDLDADHLQLRTPEARALADVLARHRPDVVIDLGEFDPGGDWIGRHGGWIRADASLQPGAVGNLPESLEHLARQSLVQPMRRALDREALTTQSLVAPPVQEGWQSSAASVEADTLRNVAALRLAAALQLESRGVGLERGHFVRRVHTHVTAVEAALRSVAKQGEAVRQTTDDARRAVSSSACMGEIVIGSAPLAEPQRRDRPCGYLISSGHRALVERLKALGIAVRRVEAPAQVRVDRYRASADAIALEPARANVQPGDFFVSMSQPLANLAAAALEPDTPASLMAGWLAAADSAQPAAVLRITEPVTLQAIDW